MKVAIAVDGTTAFGRSVFRGFLQFANTRQDWSVHEDLRRAPRGAEDCPVCDGLLVAGANADTIESLRRRARVVVGCSESSLIDASPLVCADDQQVGEIVAEHLLACAFRNFAYYGDLRIGRARLHGFERRLAAADFHCHIAPPALFENRDDRPHPWAEELARWIDTLPKPVGIFAWNDVEARELAIACKDASIPIPDQVAIIGVNNDELLCESAWPPLSSLSIDFVRVGYVAAQLLERLLAGENIPEEERKICVRPGGVIRRQSTDVLAVDDPDIARAVAIIREHACGPFTVKDLLREIPLIRRTLERRFIEKLGRTPYEEITRVRMEMAQTLLRETNETLPRIAQRCGFCAPQALNYMFRKATGQTPAAYRRLYRSEKS
ncbi:MAG TPA: DNA-binding transcriptional regulator [Phycisphaerae bacterium]|nr:DNA-binding transcriptional regulator [Phycisphaerae bacterium]